MTRLGYQDARARCRNELNTITQQHKKHGVSHVGFDIWYSPVRTDSHPSPVDAELIKNDQARSQDRFWGGAGPPKSGPFWPQSQRWTFWTSPPLTLLQKPHFWSILWLKVDLLADLGGGGCVAPTAPPPPGYGPENDEILNFAVDVKFWLRNYGNFATQIGLRRSPCLVYGRLLRSLCFL